MFNLPPPGEVPPYRTVFWRGRKSDSVLIVPVLNEGLRIRSLLNEVHQLRLAEKCDLIIVDGGSSDGSLEPDTPDFEIVTGILVKEGPGKLSAQLRCAYAFALEQGYPYILTIDGNNKDSPSALPLFIANLEQGVDFVQGSRFLPGGSEVNTPWVRLLGIRWLHAPLLRLRSGFPWTDTTQGFRGYSRRLLLDPELSVFRDLFFSYELLAYISYKAPRLGYRCLEVPTVRRYPVSGAVPTKIHGLRAYLELVAILVKATSGLYDPTANKDQGRGGA